MTDREAGRAHGGEVERLRLAVQQHEEFLDGLPDALIDLDLKAGSVDAINLKTSATTSVTTAALDPARTVLQRTQRRPVTHSIFDSCAGRLVDTLGQA